MNIKKLFDRNYLAEPVDNSSLVLFRAAFGFLIAAEGFGAIITGWVHETFIEPEFTFTFIGFEWLQPLPGNGMYFYFAVMGLCGLAVMLGFYYRIACAAYLVMWCGVYFMQKSHYNNHYYLLIILLIFMLIVPAHRYFSLDAKLHPSIKSIYTPRWAYIIFIVLLWIVYTYAGFSKIYDDWLRATPIKIWFSGKENYPIIGEVLQKDWIHKVVAYGGIFFDSLCIPMLLWKRTRLIAILMSFFFHLFNSIVFQIGIFPYMMIGALLFFIEPEKVRSKVFRSSKNQLADSTPNFKVSKVAYYAFIIFFVVQIILPLRYHLFPGNVHWTEEGHRLSWKMMLRSKSGYLRLKVKNLDSGKEETINPRDYVSRNQYNKMTTRPDMIWQLVQKLKENYRKEGFDNLEIYAISRCSLNGSAPRPLIDPTYNLAKAEWKTFSHSEWILPFERVEPKEKL